MGNKDLIAIREKEKTDSHIEVSRKGGNTTLERHGKEHYKNIGKLSYKKRLEKDPDFGKKLAMAGVEARRKKAEAKKKLIEEK